MCPSCSWLPAGLQGISAGPRNTLQLHDPLSVCPSCSWLHAGLLGISAGPGNTLLRRDPLSGVGLWTLQLDSPPVAVHLADGSSLNLYTHDSADSNNFMVVVGMLQQDSMYALPVSADWLRQSLPGPSTPPDDYVHAMPDSLALPPDESDQATRGGHASDALSVDRHGGQHNRVEQVQHEPAVGFLHSQDTALPSITDQQETNPTVSSSSHSSKSQTQRQSRRPAGIQTSSHALVAVPSMEFEDDSCAWQSPVSIHSVAPSSLPQTFLPSLSEATADVQATLETRTDSSEWIGEPMWVITMWSMSRHRTVETVPGHLRMSWLISHIKGFACILP